MGGVNKLSTATKLETSNKNEYDTAATTTNDVAVHAGKNLRVIAVKNSTYESLRELGGRSTRETFDSIVRKCIQAYTNKN